MAPIVPAGKRKFDWAPDLETLSKKADSDEEVMTGDTDELDQFEAIKDLPGIKDSAEELEEVVSAVEEAAEAAQKAVEAVKEIVENKTSEEDNAKEDETNDKDGTSDISEVVIDTEKEDNPAEAAAIVLDVVPEGDNEVPPGVKEDGKVEVEKEGMESCAKSSKTKIASKIDSKVDKKIESKETENAEDVVAKAPSAEPKKEGKWATDTSKFVRMSCLTPKNREELISYWTALGLPTEYVKAMTKDYEA